MRQMKVSEYCQKYVEPAFKRKFYEEAIKWDGDRLVSGAFYTLDVLKIWHNQAKERS